MQFFVIAAAAVTVVSAYSSYIPPPLPTGGCGGGGSSGGGGCNPAAESSQVVASNVPPHTSSGTGVGPAVSGQVPTKVSPCPGGRCGSVGSSGASPSEDYWWQGQNNPFDSPGSRPGPGSQPCSGSGCAPVSPLCPGSGCPSQATFPLPGPVPGIATFPLPSPAGSSSPGTVQNLLIPPMGICPAKYVCVNWQLCRNGLVIDDGTGAIDKQKKVIPSRIAADHTSCGGDMICCGIPEHSTLSFLGTPGRSPPANDASFLLPNTPVRPHSPVSPSSGSVSPPKFSGPASGSPIPATAIRSPTPSVTYSEPGSPSRPTSALIPPISSVSVTPEVHSSPVSPPKFSGQGTPAVPIGQQTPSGPIQFSGSASPSQPVPQPSSGPQSYGIQGPGSQSILGPSPLPSTVSQARPVSPSQPLGPVSSPLGLISPAGGPGGAMGGMMGMGMMGMMARSGSCSAGTYCVLQDQCNPYTGFILRGNAPVLAVWPDSPTVPLLPCFVPDGSITSGVCCQEAHPNAGGVD